MSASTDREVLDICHGESVIVDVPIPWEVSHVDNSLLTPTSKISIVSDCDDAVKAIISKGLAEDIPVYKVQNHDPMLWHVPYFPVLNCSSDADILFDDTSRLRAYSHNDGVFCGPLMNISWSNELLCCQHHEVVMSTVIYHSCPITAIVRHRPSVRRHM